MGKRVSVRRWPRLRRAGIVVLLLLVALVVASPWLVPRALAIYMVDRVNLPRFAKPTLPYRSVTFHSGDADLSGWLFEPKGPPRGLVIHLHGRMYTRVGGIATSEALVPLGYAVFAYDQRAHGESGGEHCTYGELEKQDLARAIDAIGIAPVYVVGHSLGAAVALQGAASDPRIRGVVAASCYDDLRTAISERGAEMPLVTNAEIDHAMTLAETKAGFRIDDVSPTLAAARITVPVLLIHGALDVDTPPAHSERLFAALHGPKRFYVVEGGDHTDLLDVSTKPVWTEIAHFFDAISASNAASAPPEPKTL